MMLVQKMPFVPNVPCVRDTENAFSLPLSPIVFARTQGTVGTLGKNTVDQAQFAWRRGGRDKLSAVLPFSRGQVSEAELALGIPDPPTQPDPGARTRDSFGDRAR